MALTISAADLATVRRRTSADSDELADTVIDALYTSTSLGNSNLNVTTYWALVELIGVLAPLVDKSNEVDSLSLRHSQRFDHLVEKVLPLWEKITGLSFQGVTLGATSTYTYRKDSLQATEPAYDRATYTLAWEE